MSVLKIKSRDINVELVLDGENTVNTAEEACAAPANKEEQLHVALIALSMNRMLAGAASHDWESDCITIQPRNTEWNSKVFGFTNTKF